MRTPRNRGSTRCTNGRRRGPSAVAGSRGVAEQPAAHGDHYDTRRPGRVYGVGEEPDPRFSLANERTALAWMRTALALVGGGVAVVSLSSLASLPRWAGLVGAAASAGGGLLAWRTVSAWARVERSLRLGRPLPSPRALVLLASGVVVLASLMMVLAFVDVARG